MKSLLEPVDNINQVESKKKKPRAPTGVKCIADDVLIYGRDDADHDSCLEGFMEKCQQKGIKLNLAKLEYKCKEVPFHGHVLTSEGLKPDPQKVEAIKEMP